VDSDPVPSASVVFIEAGNVSENTGLYTYSLLGDSISGIDMPISLNVRTVIPDQSLGLDLNPGLTGALSTHENGAGTDNTGINAYITLIETEICNESMILAADTQVADMGAFTDLLLPLNIIYNIHDTGHGQDDAPPTAKTFFLVDSSNILHPLGVIVLRGKEDLLPDSKLYREEIPGRQGSINLGRSFKPRVFELKVANSTDPSTREKLKRALAGWLNPLNGPKPLVFAEDLEKTFYVKYAGRIDLDQWPNWMEITIPFKAGNPYAIGSFEQVHTGSGTIANEGNVATSLIIELAGSATNPSVTVGDSVLTWTGTIPSGQTLLIDTGKMKVTLNGQNALGNYSGGFPKLQPGQTSVSADSQTVFRWRSRWSGC